MLEKRRIHADLVFIFKCLHVNIDCPQAFENIFLRTLMYDTVSRAAFDACHRVILCKMCRVQVRYNGVSTQDDISISLTYIFRSSLYSLTNVNQPGTLIAVSCRFPRSYNFEIITLFLYAVSTSVNIYICVK